MFETAKGKYIEWLDKDKLTLLQGWRRDGLTYEQIANNMGINVSTLHLWCKNHAEILNAIKKGEEVFIYEVENALFKAAKGYETVETEMTETVSANGETITTKRKRMRHIQPSVGAIIFILKNRRPDKWRDKPIANNTEQLADDNFIAALEGKTEEAWQDE